MKVVAISDTHNLHHTIKIPDGDVIIHAGDFTNRGTLKEVEVFAAWWKDLPHTHKICIAGNHDWLFQKQPEIAKRLMTSGHYLKDSTVVINGIKFHGSPWQPWFCAWAFNLPRGIALKEKWDMIPEDTDVLITHGPPWGHGDLVPRGELVGCEDLLKRVEKIKPQFHVFGHIHEGYGITKNDHTKFINASCLDGYYNSVNEPIVFEI